MTSSSKRLAIVGALLVAVFIVILVLARRQGREEVTVNPPPAGPKASAEGEADPEYIMIGGVRRKATDVRPVERPTSDRRRPRLDTGETEQVAFDTNANTNSIREALQGKQFAERLSVKILPKPFDLEEYRRDPQAYLDAVEPGRVFQAAQPGPGVTDAARTTRLSSSR